MNLAPTIIPKSDQLNADDLIGGPITIKITAVNSGSKEQPVSIKYEGDEGRPYKPSKSMRRVLVTIWGKDASVFPGRRLTLFRDPTVKWAGEPVGGIRISHASDIPEAVDVMLTVSRGHRKPCTVEPIPADPMSELTNLPEAWLQWGNEERGTYIAGRGTADLKKWWKSLPAPDRETLTPKLAEWKVTAEAVK